MNGNFTLQLKNDGNYQGENTNQPGQASNIGNYPEAFSAARSFPDGHLQDFQRARLLLWSIYNFRVGGGNLSVSGLVRANSARVFSLAATGQALTATQAALVAAAGYPDQPGSQTVYFGNRGSQSYAGYGVLDMSINYDVPVFRTLRPSIKFDVFNLFNNEKLIAFNTGVKQDPASGVDSLGLANGFTPGSISARRRATRSRTST